MSRGRVVSRSCREVVSSLCLVLLVAASSATAQSGVDGVEADRLDAVTRLSDWAAGGWRLGQGGSRALWSAATSASLRLPETPAVVGRGPLGPALPVAWAGQGPDTGGRQGGAGQQYSSFSGYMDFHFNDREHEDPVLDFHRFVLLFTHRFSDRVRFISELELEHALVGEEAMGELELEQAFIDFLLTRSLNFRAGMLLVPVGIINERHEPPVFHGVERPFVDDVILPTTWFDAGAGIHGEIGRGLRYRTYVMAPLDASGFTADQGIRDGRQKGAESTVRNIATTGRVEYVGLPGLSTGASFWRGKTGFAFPRIESRVTVGEVDARYRVRELEARAQYAHVWLDGMGELNRALRLANQPGANIAREIRGFYVEASYFVLPNPAPREAAVFVRYENFDTQYRMPAGFQRLQEFDRDAWVVGVSYYPDPDVALKLDYSVVRNQSGVIDEPNSLNIGLGWWF
jgi:hypothetical protein